MEDFLVDLDDRGFLLLGALLVDMAWLSCRKFVWSQNFNRLASHLPFLKVRKILYTTHPCSGVCSRRNSLHSVPVNRQTPRDAFFQKNSLSACVRRTDRKAVFFCRGSGMFHRTPLAVFSLELVAYLERAAYAFPRPRIAGGAKQEGDRNLF